ncbi:MAG: DNA primase [Thermus sp.]|uniref:DNA primase n=1 Tax=Thermus sp. TaxID=275 RepID=UPI0025E4C66D|nr:DNA primase [Thermus sp.]MCS6867416.1 DNA primase [Thermus sp.]MCS7217927.1 DNA primase [Thermus sp.]MDW8016453.1 DNA primase [Thermus sp.]MDW8357231.1 DNA primase [Thermus sp.]
MDTAQAVEAIKRRLPLKEVVSRYVVLKPAGRGRWKGLCPFHQEKTPSFYVDEEKGLFHCFGCKAGGDLFAFMERMEGLDFAGALERLAEEAGVELPQRGPAQNRRELLEVLKLAQAYFLEGLRASPEAQAYLQARGLSEASVARFGLGYAPPKGDGLLVYLSRHGVSPEEGLKAGVLAEREGRFFDRFRHRITFPIRDHLGRIVAFTGRALGEETPKYLNSPETSLFRKREVLFAYPEAKASLREGRAIVVEGLFDAIALHQMGFAETVAVLGSGLSEEQARLLKAQEVREVYLAFDADEAGQKATLQSLELELARQFLFYAVRLPAKDPGELLLHPQGPALFQKALEEALPEVAFRFQEAARDLDLTRPEHKRKVLERLTPRMLSPEPFDPVAERLKALVVERLGLAPRQLEEYLMSRKRGKPPPPPPPKAEPKNRTLLLELDVMALLLSLGDGAFLEWVRYVSDHVWPPEGSLLGEFLELARKEPRRDYLRQVLSRKEAGGIFLERLMMAPTVEEPRLPEVMEKTLARLREAYYQERLARLKEALGQKPDLELLKEIQELSQAIEAERRIYRGV